MFGDIFLNGAFHHYTSFTSLDSARKQTARAKVEDSNGRPIHMEDLVTNRSSVIAKITENVMDKVNRLEPGR